MFSCTRMKSAAVLLVALTLACSARAAEYFVSTQGDDANNGLSRESAFATVQRGVDALAPGDTLTLAPGEYFGPVRRTGLGRTGEDTGPRTVIRAEIPGTAVLRGDVPAPQFGPVDGFQFVYVADWDGDTQVQAVNEQDTLSVLRRLLNETELEFNPGSFYQDRDNDKLYIASTDLKAPRNHSYTLSVTPNHGIYLMDPQRVTIEGLAVTGFNNAVQFSHQERTHGATFGIFLTRGSDCEVRYCLAWLNGRGIGTNSRDTGGRNIIDRCKAWANRSINDAGGGALTLFEPNQDEIRNSEAFLNGRFGVLLYIGGTGGRAFNTLSWGNTTDFQLKAVHSIIAEHSVGVGTWAQDSTSRRAVHSLIGHIREEGEGYRHNIVLSDYPDLQLGEEFADPANHDYRLQSTSRFRGAADDGNDIGPYPYEPNIYYLSWNGDDAADGLSVSNAWRGLGTAFDRLSPGDTLYIEPGLYEGRGVLRLPEEGKPVAILGRGHDPVTISGEVSLEGGSARLARLGFAAGARISNAARVELENCSFAADSVGLVVEETEGLRVTHCAFPAFSRAGIRLEGTAKVFLQGNYFNNASAPAVLADSEQAILHSDYNGYASANAILRAGDRVFSLGYGEGRRDLHSTVVQARQETDSPRLVREKLVAAAGPHGTAIGPYNPVTDFDRTGIRLAGPRVHSVTSTTANIEWWTSARAGLSVAWGKGTDLGQSEAISADLAGSFSLSGLDPDTEYSFRLSAAAPITPLDDASRVRFANNAATISFRTAASDPEPVVYYVAKDGDNANTGLSRDNAWRTVNRAADKVRPGDTVLIAGGTYHEAVRLRATGDEGRPITFKCVPGEKVIFDGYDRNLTYIFYATDKAHINIDGFYFTDMGRGGVTPWPGGRNGAIILYRSDDVNITRCYMDGRGGGAYSPGLLQANHCANVLVKNCVVFSTMGGGIGFGGCPDMRIENNVFFRNYISHISEAVNTPDQKFHLKNNIFTDNLPKKVGGSFLNIGRVESMIEDNNVFYVRLPFDERTMWMFYNKVAFERAASSDALALEYDPDDEYAIKELKRMTYTEYRERFNPGSTSFAADPMFAGSLDMQHVDEDGNPIYVVDQFVGMLNRDPDLNHGFDVLFATNPEVVKRDIGLQREAFEDFGFGREN